MKKKLGHILLLFFVSSLSHVEAMQYQISVIGSRGIHIELIKNLVEKELNESSSFIVIEREKADELISEMGFQQSGDSARVQNEIPKKSPCPSPFSKYLFGSRRGTIFCNHFWNIRNDQRNFPQFLFPLKCSFHLCKMLSKSNKPCFVK